MTSSSDLSQTGESFGNPLENAPENPSNNFLDSRNALRDWEQFSAKREGIANSLSQLSELLSSAEVTGAAESGQLSLADSIHEIQQSADSLKTGTYRLMVMGDM
ncbi:MAG: hypothetical protein AAFZ17_19575, partial [Cyanobacteria bacterium J06650_10]